MMVNWAETEKGRETLEETPRPQLGGVGTQLLRGSLCRRRKGKCLHRLQPYPAQPAACRFTAEHDHPGAPSSAVANGREQPGTFLPAQRFWGRPLSVFKLARAGW